MTSRNESYLRPLFSDFAADRRVWNMTDEFMFGRAFLAAPVVEAQYTPEKIVHEDAMSGWDKKEVKDETAEQGTAAIDWTAGKTCRKYLPKGADWYDFWTGERLRGGRDVVVKTRIDRVPMFVRAGSIVPMGPEMQYVGEQTWDKLEIRVYPGADAVFTLYEDEGDSYRYEQGVYATIPFAWDEKGRRLTIGDRKGSYPGMLQERRFVVVLPDGTQKTVDYQGRSVSVAF